MKSFQDEKIKGSSYFVRILPGKTFPHEWKTYPFAVFYDVNGTPLLIVPLVPNEYNISVDSEEFVLEFPRSIRLEKMLDSPAINPNTTNTIYSQDLYYDIRDTLVLVGEMKISTLHIDQNTNMCYYTLHQQDSAPIKWTETPYVCFRDNTEKELCRCLLFPSEYNSSKNRFDELLVSDRKKIVPTTVSFNSCPKTGSTHVSFYDSNRRLITSQIFLNTNECNTKSGSLEELRAALINKDRCGIQYDLNITQFVDNRMGDVKCTIL